MAHKEHKKYYTNIKITKLQHSEVEIVGEILWEELADSRKHAIKDLGERVEIAGFRKGNIPEKVLISHLGEMKILEEAAEMTLGHEYSHIVMDHKLQVISRPEISITKLAPENNLEFKIKVAVFPDVKIPDYKKIAKAEMSKEEKIEVTDKEIDEIIAQLQKNEQADEKDPLPEITDEFIKKFGEFKSVEDFKSKIKENLTKEKIQRGKEKKRIEIGEKMVAETTIDLPEVLVESELVKMEAQLEEDISKMGLKVDDYLKHIKKTRDDIRKDWRKDAEKRVTLQIVLNRIASEEKIFADKEDLEKECAHILEHHKNADPERVQNYVETMLINEKVFQFLEGREVTKNTEKSDEKKAKKSAESDTSDNDTEKPVKKSSKEIKESSKKK